MIFVTAVALVLGLLIFSIVVSVSVGDNNE